MTWARLLDIGDITFVLRSVDLDPEDESFTCDMKAKAVDGVIYAVEIEYRIRGEATLITYYYDGKDERDEHLQVIDEDSLRGIIMKELE